MILIGSKRLDCFDPGAAHRTEEQDGQGADLVYLCPSRWWGTDLQTGRMEAASFIYGCAAKADCCSRRPPGANEGA